MPTHALTLEVRRKHCPKTTQVEQHSDILRLLDCLSLTTTEVRLARLLARSSPQPVRADDLASAVTGCPDLDHRRRVVLEQQITGLRSKLLAHNMRILCVERYGYLLLPSREE